MNAAPQQHHRPDWHPVQSSNVAAIRYVWAQQWLDVRFLNGSHYRYYDVAEAVFTAFLAAPSKGKFVWEVLRKGGYDYAKL